MINKLFTAWILLLMICSCNKSNNNHDQNLTNPNAQATPSTEVVSKVKERTVQKPGGYKEEIASIEAKIVEADQNEDHQKKGVYYMQLANLHHEKSQDIPAAIFNCQQSIGAFKVAKDTSQIANMLKYQASLFASNQQYEAAIKVADVAIDYYEKLNFDRGIAGVQLNKSQTYLKQKDYAKAEEFYLKSVGLLTDSKFENTLFLHHLHGLKLFKESEEKSKFNKLVQQCNDMKGSGKIRANLLSQFKNMTIK